MAQTHSVFIFRFHWFKFEQAQPSWDWFRETQLSNSFLTQISFAQKIQLRETQLSNSIWLRLVLFRKAWNHAMLQNQGNGSLIHPCSNSSFPNWFWGGWMFLLWIWNFYLVYMVTGLWYTSVMNLGSLTWFEGAMNIHVLKVLIWWILRTLEAPHWGLATWTWFGYGYLSLIHP